MAEKNLQIGYSDKSKFKNLILAVLQKNKNPEKYLSTDVTEPKINNKDDQLIKDLIAQYNIDHQDSIIKIKEVQTEIYIDNKNIIDKLFNLKTQNGNEKLHGEIINNIKLLIDNHDTLPI